MYEKNIENMKKNIQDIEKNLKLEDWFCPNHDLESYLYKYYCQKEKYQVYKEPLHRMYFELAMQYQKQEEHLNMSEALEKALSYNPTDVEVHMAKTRLLYQIGKWKEMAQALHTAYPFLYTRRDMGEYYSLLGCCFLETYQPDTAEALYMYSNYFYENDQAKQDLKFIETAVGRKKKDLSPEEIMQYLKEKKIPVQPKQETLALLYRVALISAEERRVEYATRLLLALYQLTGDQEVYERIQNLNNRTN